MLKAMLWTEVSSVDNSERYYKWFCEYMSADLSTLFICRALFYEVRETCLFDMTHEKNLRNMKRVSIMSCQHDVGRKGQGTGSLLK